MEKMKNLTMRSSESSFFENAGWVPTFNLSYLKAKKDLRCTE